MPLFVAPYLISVVGIAKFGVIAFSLSLAAYFSSLINYGFNITAVRDVARSKGKEELNEIFNTTITAVFLLAALSMCIGVALVYSVPAFKEESFVFLSAVMLVVFQATLPTWFFMGLEKMVAIAIFSSGSKVLYIALLLMFVNEEKDYIYVNALFSVSAALALIFALTVIKSGFKIDYQLPTLKKMRSTYEAGFSIFLTQSAPILYNNSAIFVLGIFHSAHIIGIYAAATKITESLVTIGRLLASVFLPYISKDISRHGWFSKIMIFLGFALSITVASLSKVICDFMFPEDSNTISSYIVWLSPGVFFAYVYLVYGINYLSIVSKERTIAKISIATSILGFLALWVFVPFYGAISAVLITVSARFALCCLSFAAFKKT